MREAIDKIKKIDKDTRKDLYKQVHAIPHKEQKFVIVKFKDLDSWNPAYYNNYIQIRGLKKIIIKKETLKSLQNELKTIVKNGYNSDKKIVFNKQVISFLKKYLQISEDGI